MAVSKANQRAVAKYVKNNYDRIEVKVSKGTKEVITDIAKENNQSLNGYIKDAIKSKIKADKGQDVEL